MTTTPASSISEPAPGYTPEADFDPELGFLPPSYRDCHLSVTGETPSVPAPKASAPILAPAATIPAPAVMSQPIAPPTTLPPAVVRKKRSSWWVREYRKDQRGCIYCIVMICVILAAIGGGTYGIVKRTRDDIKIGTANRAERERIAAEEKEEWTRVNQAILDIASWPERAGEGVWGEGRDVEKVKEVLAMGKEVIGF